MIELTNLLKRLGACVDAREWAEGFPDLDAAWQACQRSDWMIWLLAKTVIDADDPRLRLMICDFAEAVLHLVPAGEDRPRRAIETARRFVSGEVTRGEMASAGDAAGDAARGAARDAAQAAAWAAAWATTWITAWDADAIWVTGWDAARATAQDAAEYAAWAAAWATQAAIVKKYFPSCPKIATRRRS